MNNLKFSNIVFDEQKHEYLLGEKKLSGITHIIHQYICKDKYDGVSDETLKAASDRGSSIHKMIELLVCGFPILDKAPEVDNFIKLQLETGIHFIESEYLVSDETNFATKIDLVDDVHNLYDIKTTYELDKEYLSWQLSIDAYLFELQNGFPAGKLYGLWLRDEKCKLVEVQRIDNYIIKGLLEAAANGEEWEKPERTLALNEKDEQMLVSLADVEDAIIELDRKKDELAEQKKKLCAYFEELMEANAVYKFETDRLRITRVAAGEKTMVDSDKLKADGLYDKYSKKVASKGYVKIAVKK